MSDENAIHSDVRVLHDNLSFHSVINVCMSSDESRLIGLVTTINSVVKNSKYPVKFYVLVTSAAHDILLLVSVILFEYSDVRVIPDIFRSQARITKYLTIVLRYDLS